MAPEPGASLGVECVTLKKVLIPFTPVAKSEATGEKKKSNFLALLLKRFSGERRAENSFFSVVHPSQFSQKKTR